MPRKEYERKISEVFDHPAEAAGVDLKLRENRWLGLLNKATENRTGKIKTA
jgi:hypothetical protein